MRAAHRHSLKQYRRVALLLSTFVLAGFGAGGVAQIAARQDADSTIQASSKKHPRNVFKLEEATIADISDALREGTITCQQLVKLYLDRIAAYDDGDPLLVPPDKINSIITVNPRALETAAAMDRRMRWGLAQGPLHCIPVLLKDNIDTFDMPTSNGSIILKDAIPPDDAYIADALRDAGALILGKAAMGEFAGGSYNTVSGQTINPYNFKRQTGGSSSGSGAAIAANFAVLAVGTDTSTSVRGPSAFNGIVGLRPTTGLISRGGIAPKNLTFDTAGPMARTVTDMAIMLSAIAGPDREDPLSIDIWKEVYKRYRRQLTLNPAGAKGRLGVDYTRFLKKGSLKGARIGVARDYFGGDPVIDALAEEAIAKMKALGAEIIDPVVFDRAFINNFVFEGTTYGVRDVADYRFKEDWEAYLATFGPEVPKTVAEFVEFYDNDAAGFSGREQRPQRPAQRVARSLIGRGAVPVSHRNRAAREHGAEAGDLRARRSRRAGLSVQRQLRGANQQPALFDLRPDPRRLWRPAESEHVRRLQLDRVPGHRRPDGLRSAGAADDHFVHGKAI